MYTLYIQSSKKALSAFFREDDLGRTLKWRFSYASAVIFSGSLNGGLFL